MPHASTIFFTNYSSTVFNLLLFGLHVKNVSCGLWSTTGAVAGTGSVIPSMIGSSKIGQYGAKHVAHAAAVLTKEKTGMLPIAIDHTHPYVNTLLPAISKEAPLINIESHVVQNKPVAAPTPVVDAPPRRRTFNGVSAAVDRPENHHERTPAFSFHHSAMAKLFKYPDDAHTLNEQIIHFVVEQTRKNGIALENAFNVLDTIEVGKFLYIVAARYLHFSRLSTFVQYNEVASVAKMYSKSGRKHDYTLDSILYLSEHLASGKVKISFDELVGFFFGQCTIPIAGRGNVFYHMPSLGEPPFECRDIVKTHMKKI